MKVPDFRPAWRDSPLPTHEYFFLLFVASSTITIALHSNRPTAAIVFEKMQFITPESFAVLSVAALLTLAWRNWVTAIRLALLAPTILYAFALVVFALPTVGTPASVGMTAFSIGWMWLFIRGGDHGKR